MAGNIMLAYDASQNRFEALQLNSENKLKCSIDALGLNYTTDSITSHQGGSWSIGVNNFPAVTDISGTVSGNVDIGNFPATQTVDGTVNVGNFPAVTDISGTISGNVDIGNFPATQTVDGTVSVDNFPTIQSTQLIVSKSYDNFASSVSVSAQNTALTSVNMTGATEVVIVVSGTTAGTNTNSTPYDIEYSHNNTDWTRGGEKIYPSLQVGSTTQRSGNLLLKMPPNYFRVICHDTETVDGYAYLLRH